jgi:hypothetical protein
MKCMVDQACAMRSSTVMMLIFFFDTTVFPMSPPDQLRAATSARDKSDVLGNTTKEHGIMRDNMFVWGKGRAASHNKSQQGGDKRSKTKTQKH